MRLWWYVLLGASFLVLLASFPSGQEDCVTVNALGYDGVSGVLVPLRFCAVPGDGSVYIDAGHVYGESFKRAVQTAISVFKQRYRSPDVSVLIRVHGAPEYLDGRSVALATYAGMFSVVFGYDPSMYAFTGDLSPDGSILPVSYVREKASAFEGPVVVPQGNCGDGLICVSDVSDVEELIAQKGFKG